MCRFEFMYILHSNKAIDNCQTPFYRYVGKNENPDLKKSGGRWTAVENGGGFRSSLFPASTIINVYPILSLTWGTH